MCRQVGSRAQGSHIPGICVWACAALMIIGGLGPVLDPSCPCSKPIFSRSKITPCVLIAVFPKTGKS
ncbi:hypothetical protein BJX66DRAFT_293988 [Aspergillus keveii]|uniref:Uncharacterized protein n=1 Tax=Aspergillus keveii TaxID=714993 RepID=A0ABR4GJ83_9EURO